MKIDASRYTAFWSNPDKFRLREAWRLAPIEPAAGTFASLLSFGRRRGTAFHEILDGAYRQVDPLVTIQELKDGGFGEKEIDVAKQMAEAVRENYPSEGYLAHEALFEYPIPSSPHSLVGRIDHILKRDDEVVVGDWKTSKYRSKSDMAAKGDEYCKGAQVPFYLLGARQLGFDARRFLYRLVSSRRDNAGVSIEEFWTGRNSLELKEFARSVHQTCEMIIWLKTTFGIEKPWPALPERFNSGYETLLGRSMYENYIPDGFTQKVEHLRTAEIF